MDLDYSDNSELEDDYDHEEEPDEDYDFDPCEGQCCGYGCPFFCKDCLE